jgi:hypothetical protein
MELQATIYMEVCLNFTWRTMIGGQHNHWQKLKFREGEFDCLSIPESETTNDLHNHVGVDLRLFALRQGFVW